MANQELVYVGIKGSVLALSRTTGQIVWNTYLKGYEFVNLLLDGEVIYATTKGEIFCLYAPTGQICWNNPLTGFGWGLASIVTENCPQGLTGPAAEEILRQEQARRSSASGDSSAGAAPPIIN